MPTMAEPGMEGAMQTLQRNRAFLAFWTIALAALLAILCSGCTTWSIEGIEPKTNQVVWRVSETGAPLVTRTASMVIVHEWMNEETGTLHQITVSRNTDEKTDAQAAFMEALLKAAVSSGALTGGVPPLPPPITP